MNSLVDHNAHFEQLVNYFASFLRDITATISQVKSLAYMLINVPQPNSKNMQITSDVSSIMVACKRTYDDIKRAESIIRGHVKGKGSQASPSASRVSSNKKIGISASKFPNLQLNLERLDQEKVMEIQSAKDLTGTPYKFTSPQQKESPIKAEEQTKSTRITNPLPLGEQRKIKEVPISRSESGNPKPIQTKIQNIRLSRNKDLKDFASENEDCLSLIQKIRDQLQIKKKR